MANIKEPATIPPELMAEMRERAERATRGVVDRETRRIALERMDKMRAEYLRRHGVVELAVDLIREARVDA